MAIGLQIRLSSAQKRVAHVSGNHVLSQNFGVAQYRTVNLTVHRFTRVDALGHLIITNPA